MHFCDAILHLLFSLVPLDPGVKNRRTYFIQNLHPTHSYAIAFGEEIEHQMFGRGLSLCLSVYQCVSSAFVLLSPSSPVVNDSLYSSSSRIWSKQHAARASLLHLHSFWCGGADKQRNGQSVPYATRPPPVPSPPLGACWSSYERLGFRIVCQSSVGREKRCRSHAAVIGKSFLPVRSRGIRRRGGKGLNPIYSNSVI